jgi:S1-C subfamily serine protease
MIAKSALFELAKAMGGLPVLGCLQGTPAHLAGVRYGDILLSVNGKPTRTFGDYVEAKALRQDGMHIVLFRSGVEEPISLDYHPNRAPMDSASLLAELVSMRILSGDGAEGGEGPVS